MSDPYADLLKANGVDAPAEDDPYAALLTQAQAKAEQKPKAEPPPPAVVPTRGLNALEQAFFANPANTSLHQRTPEQMANLYGSNDSITASPQPEGNITNALRGMAVNTGVGLDKSRLNAQAWMGDLLDLTRKPTVESEVLQKDRLRQYDAAQGRADAAKPAYNLGFTNDLYDATTSLAQTAPSLALAVATKNPALGLGLAGMQSADYLKYKERGATVGEASLGAAGEGAVEILTEKSPMGLLVNKYGSMGAKEFLGQYLIKEGLGEQAATLAQDAIDTAIANPDKTWSDYWKERPNAAYQTALATLVTGGAVSAPKAIAEVMAGTPKESGPTIDDYRALVQSTFAGKPATPPQTQPAPSNTQPAIDALDAIIARSQAPTEAAPEADPYRALVEIASPQFGATVETAQPVNLAEAFSAVVETPPPRAIVETPGPQGIVETAQPVAGKTDKTAGVFAAGDTVEVNGKIETVDSVGPDGWVYTKAGAAGPADQFTHAEPRAPIPSSWGGLVTDNPSESFKDFDARHKRLAAEQHAAIKPQPAPPADIPQDAPAHLFGMSGSQLEAMQGGKMKGGDQFPGYAPTAQDIESRKQAVENARAAEASAVDAAAGEDPRIASLKDAGIPASQLLQAANELKGGDDSLAQDLARIHDIKLPAVSQPAPPADTDTVASATDPELTELTKALIVQMRDAKQMNLDHALRKAIDRIKSGGMSEKPAYFTKLAKEFEKRGDTKTAGMLGQVADTLKAKQKATPKPAKPPKPKVSGLATKDPGEYGEAARRVFLQVIKKSGGVSINDAADITGETRVNSSRMSPGFFAAGAPGIDLVARRLHEAGYITDAEYNEADGGVQVARDLINNALRKQPVLTSEQQERMAELEAMEADAHAELQDQAEQDMLAEIIGETPTAAEFDALFDVPNDETQDEAGLAYTQEQENDAAETSRIESQAGEAVARGAAAGEESRAGVNGRAAVQGADQEARPELSLAQHTERDLAERERELNQREAEHNARERAALEKEKADRQRDDFSLTGSNRASDANAGQADIFGQPVVNQDSEFTHAGYTIKPIKVRIGEALENRWNLQNEDNRLRALKGEREIGGDSLHQTREAAIAEAERQSVRAEQDRKLEAERKADEDASKAKEQERIESNRGLSIVERKANSTLQKEIRLDGKVITLREAVEMLVARGEELTTETEPKIKPMSRMQFNRANNQEQAAHEKRMKEAGNKTVYYIGGFDLGKTAYDYALTLQAKPEPTAAPITEKQSKTVENFGESLPPARRSMAAKLDESLTDDDISARPLSEIWPHAENEAIEDTFAAAVAHAARAEIPSKPRVGYKVKQWVKKVQMLRELAAKIVSGRVSRDEFINTAGAYALRDWIGKVKLLEQLPRDQWKRVETVEERPDAYTYQDGVQVPTPMLRLVIDGKPHYLRNGGTVADNMAEITALLADAAPEKRMEFEIRRPRSGGKYFINKKGDSQYRRLMEFDTAEEARSAIGKQYDALVGEWENVKARDNITERDLRSTENRPRVGKDHRGGRDVTPEEFQTAFGFRGGEFGKWVQQGKGDKNRQDILNSAFDALHDLAEIVGVPPAAISLNGTLGIAFGSRGSGWASAHFEPSNLVINLTKTRGAGALAHEWFHALDNYFSRLRGGEVAMAAAGSQKAYRDQNYITHQPEPLMVRKNSRYSEPMTLGKLKAMHEARKHLTDTYNPDNWQRDPKHREGVRPEVEQRFAALVESLNDSPMTKRARLLDGKKSGDGYWSSTLERAARTFENFVQARMLEDGYHNDFLANVKAANETGKNDARYPYLMPGEIKPIAEAFDALFGEIKTKETDSGIAMFSRGNPESAGNTGAVTQVELDAVIKRVASGWKRAQGDSGRLITVETAADLPAAILRAEQAQNVPQNEIKGVFHNGHIYLVRDNHTDARAVEETIFHEAYGHYGARLLNGNDAQKLSAAFSDLWKRIGALDGVRKMADKFGVLNQVEPYIKSLATADMPLDTKRRIIVDELLAHVAGRGEFTLKEQAKAYLGALRVGLRNAARAMKLDGIAQALDGYTDAELLLNLKQMREAVVSGAGGKGSGTLFARTATMPGQPQATQQPSDWRDPLGRMQFAPAVRLKDAANRGIASLVAKSETAQAVYDAFKIAPPKLQIAIRKMKATQQQALDQAGEVAKATNTMTPAEKALVSDIIEGMVKPGVVPPEHIVAVADRIRSIMDAQTDELVKLGMLAKDTAERWRGKYLPRFYNRQKDPALDTWGKKLLKTAMPIRGMGGNSLKARGLFQTVNVSEVGKWEALGWEVRDPLWENKSGKLELKQADKLLNDPDSVQIWRDFNPAERENMGEIRDAVFRFAMGYTAMQNDIALGRMFDAIARNPEWTRPRAEDGYVHVPETEIADTGGVKRYGNLAGLYVRKDIMSHLSQHDEGGEVLKLYRRAMGLWKMGKVPMNPVSHANNTVSNLTMAHLAGVSYWDGHKYAAAMRDFMKGAPMLDEAKETGLLTGDITRAEILAEMPQEIRDMLNMQESQLKKKGRAVYDLMTYFLRKPMLTAYRFEDDFFKYLIYRDARTQGLKPEDAMLYATQYIFNYDDLPKGARAVRDAAIPFFSYTYKAFPALIHAATHYPWRFLAPSAVVGGYGLAVYGAMAALMGGDDDEWDKALEQKEADQKNLAPWDRGKSLFLTDKTFRTGAIDDRTGLPVFMNIYRFLPGGDMLDTGHGESTTLPAPLMPSHPILGILAAMIPQINKDVFTGKELVDKNDTGAEVAKKRLNYLTDALAPAIAPTGYHADRLLNTLADSLDTTISIPFIDVDYTGIGKDGLPIQAKYAIPQTFGVKMRPVDLERNAEFDAIDDKTTMLSIKREVRSAKMQMQRGSMTERQYQSVLADAKEKINRMRAE